MKLSEHFLQLIEEKKMGKLKDKTPAPMNIKELDVKKSTQRRGRKKKILDDDDD